MKAYRRPVITVDSGLSEGIYLASGSTDKGLKCDSKYMKGVWQAPDYSRLELWNPRIKAAVWLSWLSCKYLKWLRSADTL